MTIFNHTNPKVPFISKAKMTGVIFDINSDIPNADINYAEGYLDAEENFVNCGVNRLHIQDKEAVIDPETQEILEPASTDYTDFMSLLDASTDTAATAETYLIEKVGV
jgi:hypothetical protein